MTKMKIWDQVDVHLMDEDIALAAEESYLLRMEYADILYEYHPYEDQLYADGEAVPIAYLPEEAYLELKRFNFVD